MNNELTSTRYAIWLGSSANIRLLQEKQIKDKQVKNIDDLEKIFESVDEDYIRNHRDVMIFASFVAEMVQSRDDIVAAIEGDLTKDYSLTDRQVERITDYTINGYIATLAGVVHATKKLETMQRDVVDETLQLLETKVKEFMDKPETEVAGIYLQQVINKIKERDE